MPQLYMGERSTTRELRAIAIDGAKHVTAWTSSRFRMAASSNLPGTEPFQNANNTTVNAPLA